MSTRFTMAPKPGRRGSAPTTLMKSGSEALWAIVAA
jgi:hypothetical protein